MRERGHFKSRVKPDQLVFEIRESKAKEGREEVRSRRPLNTGGRQARRGHVVEGHVYYMTKYAKAVTQLLSQLLFQLLS